jgi:hypothetical protein
VIVGLAVAAALVFGVVLVVLIANGPIDATSVADWLWFLFTVVCCALAFCMAILRILVEYT